jgi:hypothetical protein
VRGIILFFVQMEYHKTNKITTNEGMKPPKCLPSTGFPQKVEGKQNIQYDLEVYVSPLPKYPRSDCSRGEHGEW